MTVFVTSDLHADHTKMVTHFGRDEYNNVDEMNDDLVKQWNSVVTPQDTVYVLGDVGMKPSCVNTLRRLNGKIKLIPGNHDSRQILNRIKAELSHNWEILPQYYELKVNGVNYVMSHFPLARWNKAHYGSIHLYGHEHGTYYMAGNCVDVGIDSVYRLLGVRRPVLLSEVENLIALKNAIGKSNWENSHHE